MKNNIVSIAQEVCSVCGTKYDNGELLLAKRLSANLPDKTVTGWGLCPLHQKMHDDGYVALVAIDPAKSGDGKQGALKPENAYRTGRVAHVRRSAWGNIFDGEAPKGPLAYCGDDLIELLEQT